MYASQISSVMGYTSTAMGIYAFGDIYPTKQRYMLRWLAATVMIFGLAWGGKATRDYKLILKAMREPDAIVEVYVAAEQWPIAMYLYTSIMSVLLVMLVLRKLLQVHKLSRRVKGLRTRISGGVAPSAEQKHKAISLEMKEMIFRETQREAGDFQDTSLEFLPSPHQQHPGGPHHGAPHVQSGQPAQSLAATQAQPHGAACV